MQQVYISNPHYDLSNPILNTQITFHLNKQGRLSRIIWRYETSFGKPKEPTWGDETREAWDLEKDANQYDLIHAFRHLALGNPTDFKTLYFTLKEHDDIIFPCIEETLKQVKELYNFS